MWIIERNSCLKICPCCGRQAEYVQRFPQRSLAAYRRIKIKHMVTSVVHSHTPRLQVSSEPKRFLQLSVSGQAASLQRWVVSNQGYDEEHQCGSKMSAGPFFALLVITEAGCTIFAYSIFLFLRCLLWTPISHKHNEKNEVISWVSGWSRCGQLNYGFNNRSIETAEWCNNSNKLTKSH